jgi:glycosyltransferase involved in cell wall biosynthesis
VTSEVVRWPRDGIRAASGVAVVTVSYNTAWLTSLLIWSLYQVLRPGALDRVVVVDNGSTDGSARLLSGLAEAGLCELVANRENRHHGPGLNQGLSHLAEQSSVTGRGPAWVWILDSDCVVARPQALDRALQAASGALAAVVGESQPDPWHGTDRFGTHCLLIAPAATWRDPLPAFEAGGDPSYAFLLACRAAGLRLADFGFLRDGYVIHRGRGTLARLAESEERSNPLYSWALEHHQAHFGGIDGAAGSYDLLTARFRAAVPRIDAVTLVAACTSGRPG